MNALPTKVCPVGETNRVVPITVCRSRQLPKVLILW
ncbi:Uncharacterised protein [Mycobacteroides abscessus subsp. abscessus]|nr:Uncharacterised protein [Mycobacteroides abscessus subsp. abscessus]